MKKNINNNLLKLIPLGYNIVFILRIFLSSHKLFKEETKKKCHKFHYGNVDCLIK